MLWKDVPCSSLPRCVVIGEWEIYTVEHPTTRSPVGIEIRVQESTRPRRSLSKRWFLLPNRRAGLVRVFLISWRWVSLVPRDTASSIPSTPAFLMNTDDRRSRLLSYSVGFLRKIPVSRPPVSPPVFSILFTPCLRQWDL